MGADQRFLKGTIVAFVGIALGSASEFGVRLLVARHLTPEEYGFVVLGFTILQVVTLFALLGTSEGLARHLKYVDRQPVVFTGTVITTFVTAVILAFLLLGFRSQLTRVLSLDGAPVVFVLFAAAIPFQVLMKVSVGGFRAIERASGKVIIQNFSVQTLRFVLVVALVATGAGITTIAFGWVLPIAVGALVALFMLFSRTELLTTEVSIDHFVSDIRKLLEFSAPLMIAGMIWMLIQYTDNLLVGYYLTSESVGLYNSAFTLAEIFIMIPAAFGFLYLPMFTNVYNDDNRDAMRRFYTLATKWMVFVAFPAFAAYLFFAEPIMIAIYGGEYRTAELALRLVAVGLFAHVVFGLNGNTLVSIGQPKLLMHGNLVGFFGNVVLNVLLIPLFGIEGAAIASMISFVLVNGYWAGYLYRITGLHPVTKSMFVPLVGSFAGFAALRYLFDPTGTLPLAGAIVSGTVLHAIVVVVLGGIQQEEIALLERINANSTIDLSPLIASIKLVTPWK